MASQHLGCVYVCKRFSQNSTMGDMLGMKLCVDVWENQDQDRRDVNIKV